MSYLLGADPARWRPGVPAYGSVTTRDLWPGVDLVLRSAGGRLKYEFVVAPGASVDAIRLAYEGATDVRLDAGGALRVRTPRGVLSDERPVAYQEVDGRRIPVASRFVLRREGGRPVHGFAVGAYRPAAPLVIDPGLLYATYLGGAGGEHAYGVAADAAGDVYVTGSVDSAASAEPGGTSVGPGGRGDVFVAKIRPSAAGAASLVYLTFLGGGGPDEGRGIALGCPAAPNAGACEAYVTGWTQSSNFPITPFAVFASSQGKRDAFVARFAATGAALGYSTYLGGNGDDLGNGVAVACDAARLRHAPEHGRERARVLDVPRRRGHGPRARRRGRPRRRRVRGGVDDLRDARHGDAGRARDTGRHGRLRGEARREPHGHRLPRVPLDARRRRGGRCIRDRAPLPPVLQTGSCWARTRAWRALILSGP